MMTCCRHIKASNAPRIRHRRRAAATEPPFDLKTCRFILNRLTEIGLRSWLVDTWYAAIPGAASLARGVQLTTQTVSLQFAASPWPRTFAGGRIQTL
jgi:hypothetical protein